jgi:hypothetical protein
MRKEGDNLPPSFASDYLSFQRRNPGPYTVTKDGRRAPEVNDLKNTRRVSIDFIERPGGSTAPKITPPEAASNRRVGRGVTSS